jgi:two-component system, OmpR family, sensor kinase
LMHASNAVAEALRADKVDVFLYDDSRDSLVAVGTSTQPLSELQKKLGLDVLPISNGGRSVSAFQTGKTYFSGRSDEDPEELRGVKVGLKVKSQIGAVLEVGGKRRGVLMIASRQPDFFKGVDVTFTEAVARWVAIVAHRAELMQQITQNAVEAGRRAVAEELITVLAHDLRNHLTPLTARMQLVRNRAQRDHRQDDVREMEMALRNVQRLTRMISDLLDVARLDQGIFQLDVQPTDLGAVAAEIAKTLTAPDHQVLVEVAQEIVVAADVRRVQQCVENLVANAIQHSPRGAAVNVVVSAERHDGRSWGLFEVRNEGPGIPPEVMPRVFERFAAGPGSTGLGLGLYLARRIAVAHGGDLTAESQPGKGACFVLRLPTYRQ